jgi:hypothetical protein
MRHPQIATIRAFAFPVDLWYRPHLNFSLQVLGTVNPARPRSETNKSNDEIGDEGEESDEDQFFDVSPVSGAKRLRVFSTTNLSVSKLFTIGTCNADGD